MNEYHEFDDDFAAELVGKTLLVGLTYQDHAGAPQDRLEFHGIILRISQDDGIVILRGDNLAEFTLPPDLNSIQKASPGKYALCTTAEVVRNPDYLTTWTITAPGPEAVGSAGWEKTDN